MYDSKSAAMGIKNKMTYNQIDRLLPLAMQCAVSCGTLGHVPHQLQKLSTPKVGAIVDHGCWKYIKVLNLAAQIAICILRNRVQWDLGSMRVLVIITKSRTYAPLISLFFSVILYAEKSAQDTQIACANTKCTQKRGKTEHIGLYN